MSQQHRDEESELPRTGVKIVAGIVLGILVVLALVGWIWKLYNSNL